VLQGGEHTIERYQPVLYIEAHDRPGADRSGFIQEWCEGRGYAVVDWDGIYVCVPPEMGISDLQLPLYP